MTPDARHAFSAPVQTTGAWAAWWRSWYRFIRLLGRPLMWLALGRGFANIVVLRVVGRRSGAEHTLPLGLLTVGGQRYIGHPNGDTAWTLNLRAADSAVIASAHGRVERVRPIVLPPGTERDGAVRATFRQHPFPGNAFYRLAAGHVHATGVFFRLEDDEAANAGSTSGQAGDHRTEGSSAPVRRSNP